jgi:nicotinamide-nucleotide amidase
MINSGFQINHHRAGIAAAYKAPRRQKKCGTQTAARIIPVSGAKIFPMNELENLARQLGDALLARGELLTAAESCTGGWLAQSVTAIAGSSSWFERGFVTYSNDAKVDMLGVPETTLTRHGAVSEATARAMAQGALAHSRAHWSVAITGIAGPTGGSADKPVGTVCFAWASKEGACEAELRHFTGDRAAVREQSVRHGLLGLLQRVVEASLLA